MQPLTIPTVKPVAMLASKWHRTGHTSRGTLCTTMQEKRTKLRWRMAHRLHHLSRGARVGDEPTKARARVQRPQTHALSLGRCECKGQRELLTPWCVVHCPLLHPELSCLASACLHAAAIPFNGACVLSLAHICHGVSKGLFSPSPCTPTTNISTTVITLCCERCPCGCNCSVHSCI
jgi:hypothetical protein